MVSKKTKNNLSQDDSSTQALQQIANCLGYLVVHSDELKSKSNRDLIPILASLGFDRNTISSILQTTPETVSVRLSQLKAASTGKTTSKSKIQPEPNSLQDE